MHREPQYKFSKHHPLKIQHFVKSFTQDNNILCYVTSKWLVSVLIYKGNTTFHPECSSGDLLGVRGRVEAEWRSELCGGILKDCSTQWMESKRRLGWCVGLASFVVCYSVTAIVNQGCLLNTATTFSLHVQERMVGLSKVWSASLLNCWHHFSTYFGWHFIINLS